MTNLNLTQPRTFRQWLEIYRLYRVSFPRPERKPFSMQADFSLLGAAVAAALEGRQLQPIVRG